MLEITEDLLIIIDKLSIVLTTSLVSAAAAPRVVVAIPVFYEENIEADSAIVPSFLDDYVLLNLEQGTDILSDSRVEIAEVTSIVFVSSSPPPTPNILVEVKKSEGKLVTSS